MQKHQSHTTCCTATAAASSKEGGHGAVLCHSMARTTEPEGKKTENEGRMNAPDPQTAMPVAKARLDSK